MSKKLDSDQIKILAGLGLTVAVMAILAFFLLGDDPEDQNKPSSSFRTNATIPKVPQKERKEFKGRLESAKQEEETKAQAVNLDIFKVDENEEESGDVFTVEEEQKATPEVVQQSKPVARRQPVRRSEPEPEPVKDDTDDIMMSSSLEDQMGGGSVASSVSTSGVEISAVVHDRQVVTDGQRVTLRVTEGYEKNGKKIRQGRFIYANARFEQNRVQFDFSRLTYDDGSRVTLEPLMAYDGTDFKMGVYSEQLSEQEYTGETGEDIVDEVGNDGSLATKIAKGLVKKKLREVSVELRDNTKVIIK